MSCHKMKIIHDELARTTHYKNRAGIRVECRDCHVPREQFEKFVTKIQAVDDIHAHFIGTVDTPEKFEERRLAMAQTVWESMRASGSRPCLTCHSFDAMELEKLASRPRFKHEQAKDSSATCIDCHKGVAHKLPAGFRNDDH